MVMVMEISDQDWEDESYATAADEQPESAFNGAPMREMGVLTSDVGGNEDSDVEALTLTLPESTYSFLFTESAGSVPFVFSLGIVAMSYTCLVLALINNLQCENIPTNVDLSVRVAQYLSILIALLMEEEIPTGLYLLRRISRPYLLKIFPKISYHKFVCSSILRITMGYLFLVNVLVVLIQADTVIEIFYDVLALEFIQKLDDIGFSVSKMEVLGKRLQRATTTPYFHANLQKENESLGLKWRVRMFLKAVYFINFAIFLAVMIVVSTRQMSGYYQCESVSVKFGDKVWKDAIVQWPEHSVQYPPGLIEEMVLVFSYFDGMYSKDPHRTHENRPVYIEQKKSDRTPFDATAPLYHPYQIGSSSVDSIKPAEIKYCGGYWIFSHDYIRRSRKDKSDETCAWLARSPKTAGFDLEVDGKWQIWAGVILETDVTVRCNTCSDDIDCNLNGVCNESSGKCDCDVDDDAVYLGSHCEVKLAEECRTIISERYNDTWSVDVTGFSGKASAWMRESGETYQEYSRPVYTYVEGLPSKLAPEEGDSFSLIYSGSRWFRISLRGARDETASEFWAWQTANYHAFWAGAYSPGVTTLVSESSYNDSPVGVDFYIVGESGNQFGAFGALYPAQLNNITGRGMYRCKVEMCSFCTNGITVDEDYVIPDDFVSLRAAGYTCGFFIDNAPQWEEGSIECYELQMTEQVCCPP